VEFDETGKSRLGKENQRTGSEFEKSEIVRERSSLLSDNQSKLHKTKRKPSGKNE
jgi:hypothetical protein